MFGAIGHDSNQPSAIFSALKKSAIKKSDISHISLRLAT